MMKKNLKFIVSTLIIIALLFICANLVFAATPDMNLPSNTIDNVDSNVTNTNTDNTVNNITNSLSSNTTSSANTTVDASESTQIKNLNPVTDSGLGLTNILNILLIAVGLVLILLGIAIIIKIKN